MHVKMLNGIPFGPLKVGKHCARSMFHVAVTRDDYKNALQSLESFHVVLTLASVKEEPEKVACVLQRSLGWNVTALPKKNVKRPKKHATLTIDDNELQKAKADNVWDINLYKHAQELEADLFRRLGCV